MNMEMKVIGILIEGELKYAPCYVINGKEHMISHQGRLYFCDTEEQAQEYIKDEEELFTNNQA